METLSALLAICAGIHRSPVNSPHKCKGRGALMIYMICVWTNGRVNNREDGDLRRHHAQYDVIVMIILWIQIPYIHVIYNHTYATARPPVCI